MTCIFLDIDYNSNTFKIDFSTYFNDSIPGSQSFYPKYILSSSCCSKDDDIDDSDVIEEHSVLNGDAFGCLDDAQDTSSLWVRSFSN